jgi:hypothetical protein
MATILSQAEFAFGVPWSAARKSGLPVFPAAPEAPIE